MMGLVVVSFFSGCCPEQAAFRDQDRWLDQLGGVNSCPDLSQRLSTACQPLLRAAGTRTEVRVVDSDRPGAWSWPNGKIYVSKGLMAMLTDAELAAVVGHELGHLLREGHVKTQVALASSTASSDVEADADDLSRSLLRSCGQDDAAMRSVLLKLADHPSTPALTRSALLVRARRLH